MNCLQKARELNPDLNGHSDDYIIGNMCPGEFGLRDYSHDDLNDCSFSQCAECWAQKAESESEKVIEIGKQIAKGFADGVSHESATAKPHILDSGNRREFETGAVRDICEGKGRCDLLPLDVVGNALANPTFNYIADFMSCGDQRWLYDALSSCGIFHDYYTLMLEVAKHFEEGCKKYGDNNWQKGIPAHCYIDSAVRHYLKYLRGDKDEPHDRAFCWNILCCIWTCIHKPELNDYTKEETKE